MHQFPAVRPADQFNVSLSGEMVACSCREDAAAVRVADAILSGHDRSTHQPIYLKRLVRLLLRYGRIRAACLLSGSVVGLLSHCLASLEDDKESAAEHRPLKAQIVEFHFHQLND
ncbi:hypothetical protein [Lacipirellula parvula]|uniref:Uncharacterized protein n=1 Tax=Lacipirellula parvula TaxID=2650471 RepID=A0A5K7XDX2_9BACT|nr:hypothetical protein [Lacipirellula parvula]BBO34257.1 hypothetical protein PLANPX_3869 [Lacipirellula parvula]